MLAAAVVSLVAAPSAFAGATLPDVTQINPPPPAAQTPADGALPQHDLAGNGYVETEWKVKLTSPEVYALSAAGGLAATASPAPTAAGAPLSGDYASRILVRAPQDNCGQHSQRRTTPLGRNLMAFVTASEAEPTGTVSG